MKKLISVLLCLLMVLSPACIFAAGQSTDAVFDDTAKYIYKAVAEPQVGSIGGEWAVLGLARSGADISEEYYQQYYENVEEYVADRQGVLHERKYTEYSRVVLALTSIGADPQDVSGYNLVAPLEDYDKTVYQGINGAIFALIALDSGNYIPESAVREQYVEHILDKQTADGGWSVAGGTADVDTTAMALQALSNYLDRADVKAAVDKGLDCISDMQLDNGGFASFGEENAESCAQVIVALCELGIDTDDEQFVKNGKSVVDSLLTYYIPGNGFKHTKGEPSGNQMATEQAFYALAALDRANSGRNSLYDMSDAENKLLVTRSGKSFAEIIESVETAKNKALEYCYDSGILPKPGAIREEIVTMLCRMLEKA